MSVQRPVPASICLKQLRKGICSLLDLLMFLGIPVLVRNCMDGLYTTPTRFQICCLIIHKFMDNTLLMLQRMVKLKYWFVDCILLVYTDFIQLQKTIWQQFTTIKMPSRNLLQAGVFKI